MLLIDMNYNVITNVREDKKLRDSFNELTQKTFYFNFKNWYENGYWTDKYIPHVIVDGDKVVSNISVNLMQFEVHGQLRNYIQLGTVMTDPDYRKQGLNKVIMNSILKEYSGKVDGIYLFANDSVLDYYPKYGFAPINEYEYSLSLHKTDSDSSNIGKAKYRLEKLDLSNKEEENQLFRDIAEYGVHNTGHNSNEDLAMYDNLGLYQFWLADEYRENVYYLPEEGAYILAGIESGILQVDQIISQDKIDMHRLAASFEEDLSKVKLGFTPKSKEEYDAKLHKVEDCTLFVIGESLQSVEKDKMMFPVISHA